MAADSFRDYVLDQLAGVPGLRCVAMFGGHGLYRADDFFAILHAGRLYFKTDAATRTDYVDRGMKPFRATRDMVLKNYYEVPPDIVEDAQLLFEWANAALAVRQRSRPRPAKRRTRNRARRVAS